MSKLHPVDWPKRLAAVQAQAEQRLSNLAIELGAAGVQTLMEDFGWGQEQAGQWLDKMLARARKNRVGDARNMLAQWEEGVKHEP